MKCEARPAPFFYTSQANTLKKYNSDLLIFYDILLSCNYRVSQKSIAGWSNIAEKL